MNGLTSHQSQNLLERLGRIIEMGLRLVLFCWICLGVFVTGCGTASQTDKNGYPKAQVIGQGTQRSGWLGVGVTIPLPGMSSGAPPSRAAGSGDAQSDGKR